MITQEPQLFPKQIGRYLVYLNTEGQLVIIVNEDVMGMTDQEAEGIFAYMMSRSALFYTHVSKRKVGSHEKRIYCNAAY